MERSRKKEEGEEEKSRYFILFFFFAGAKTRDTEKNQGRQTQREKRGRLSGRAEVKIERDCILDPPIFISFVFVFWPVGSILSHPARYIVIHNTAYTHTFKNNHTVEYSKREIKKMD